MGYSRVSRFRVPGLLFSVFSCSLVLFFVTLFPVSCWLFSSYGSTALFLLVCGFAASLVFEFSPQRTTMTAFGRREAETSCLLNIYDLHEYNQHLYGLGLGMYHSGVEIGGVEYTFSSGSGVFNHAPRAAGGAKFRETVNLGTLASSSAVGTAIEELRHEFRGTDYNVLERNCNHFAEALVWRLLGKQLPGYVNRMAGFGAMFSCLMPQSMLKDAPVDGNGGGRSSASSSSSSSGPRGGAMDRTVVNAFGGSGFKLGGSADEATEGLLTGADDRSNGGRGGGNGGGGGRGGSISSSEAARREVMREAALKRLQQNTSS